MEAIASLVSDNDFSLVSRWIETGDITIRKQFLLLCRYMGVDVHGNLSHLTYDARLSLITYIAKYEGSISRLHTTNLWDEISNRINRLVSDPFFCGGLIMSLFLAPLETEEIKVEKLASYMKEINVMDSEPYLPKTNFNTFFGEYDEPFHSSMKPNPFCARIVHKAIDDWKNSIRVDRVVYPHISSKLLPKLTQRDMRQYLSLIMEPMNLVTQGSVELLYSKYGISWQEGACGMSQRWYTNGLAPRSYFINGPEGYDRAKYLKNIFNDLNQSLVTVTKFNRVNVGRIHIKNVETAIFYDLTSFTSNCALQRPFLDMLSRYCGDTEISIMDTHVGPLQVNLGDLIRDYNQMNHCAEYENPLFDSFTNSRHGVAGFLGVPGNIATCTFLHGAFLLQLCDHTYQCGCAGDDAVVINSDEGYVFGCVSLIGILAVEKTFVLEPGDPAVVYLKRRTFRAAESLRQYTYFQFPSFIEYTAKHNIRSLSRFREAFYKPKELRRLTESSLMSSFISAKRLQKLPCFDRIQGFMYEYYSLMNLPIQGHVPQFQLGPSTFIPSMISFGYGDFVIQTLESLFPGYARLPLRSDMSNMTRIPILTNTIFQSSGGPEVALLKKMGVIKVIRKARYLCVGDIALSKTIHEYTVPRKEPIICSYEVLLDHPDFCGTGTVDGIVDDTPIFSVPDEPDFLFDEFEEIDEDVDVHDSKEFRINSPDLNILDDV